MISKIKHKQTIIILVTIGSVIMLGFGIWHFFIPSIWKWYNYIDPQATELVVATRAINVFFSLCLVLIGIANLLLFYFKSDVFSKIVILAISTILWITRVTLQIVYPQGSQNFALQYGMLATFSIVLSCFSISLLLVIVDSQNRSI